MSRRECADMEKAIKMWLEERYSKIYRSSVEEVAHRCGVSRSGLYRALKRHGYK